LNAIAAAATISLSEQLIGQSRAGRTLTVERSLGGVDHTDLLAPSHTGDEVLDLLHYWAKSSQFLQIQVRWDGIRVEVYVASSLQSNLKFKLLEKSQERESGLLR
jgi:hypothetical protein